MKSKTTISRLVKKGGRRSKGVRGAIGHFTQLVWAGTEKLGCALVKSVHGTYVVARYSKGGNISTSDRRFYIENVHKLK